MTKESFPDVDRNEINEQKKGKKDWNFLCQSFAENKLEKLIKMTIIDFH